MDPAVNLTAEWGVVSGAPALSIGTVLLVIAVVWAALHFIYRQRVERLKEALQNEQAESTRLRGRVGEYEAKAGRTPDEAHAKIEALEARVRTLAPRHLAPSQRGKLTAAMKPFEGEYVHIVADEQVHEAVNLQQELLSAFSAANWNISQTGATMLYHDVEETPGMLIHIPQPAHPSPAEDAVMRALTDCGLTFGVRQSTQASPGILITISARF